MTSGFVRNFLVLLASSARTVAPANKNAMTHCANAVNRFIHAPFYDEAITPEFSCRSGASPRLSRAFLTVNNDNAPECSLLDCHLSLFHEPVPSAHTIRRASKLVQRTHYDVMPP